MNKETKIVLGTAVVIIAALTFVAVYFNEPTASVDTSLLVRDYSPIVGNRDAKVVLVEFGDYQCPACAQAHPVVNEVIDMYSDNPDFAFVYRHFPLSQHNNAKNAARAVEAAGAQGKYWEMHDLLYERQNRWASNSNVNEIFTEYAQDIGLDVELFTQALDDEELNGHINDDMDDARKLGVNSTPTFYLNGERLGGIGSLESFKTRIDTLLAQ